MLEVIDISFDDADGKVNPPNIYDLIEMVTVYVGENGAGNYYHFYLVTNKSISKLDNKMHIFKIEKWEGVDTLIEKLNSFIKDKLDNNVKEDPYKHLSKYWQWEYEGYNS